jgi:hypothetical protein
MRSHLSRHRSATRYCRGDVPYRPERGEAAQEPLTPRPRIGATLIGTANGTADQMEVCDSSMLFEHVCVDERR